MALDLLVILAVVAVHRVCAEHVESHLFDDSGHAYQEVDYLSKVRVICRNRLLKTRLDYQVETLRLVQVRATAG